MTPFPPTAAGYGLREIEAQRKKELADAEAAYESLVGRVAKLGDRGMSREDVALLGTLLKQLGIDPQGFARQCAQRPRVDQLRREADALIAQAETLPPVADLRRQLDALNTELAEAITRLLEPKRELERMIEDRLEHDEAVRNAETLHHTYYEQYRAAARPDSWAAYQRNREG